MSTIRIATFNIENLENQGNSAELFEKRVEILRPQMKRINADILCLQEVHGQEIPGESRQLLALNKLLRTTEYADYDIISTKTTNNEVYDVRNLVIISKFEILEHNQYRHDFTSKPAYKKVTSDPLEPGPDDVTWERPVLYAKIKVSNNTNLHLINLHLKSKLPSNIPGQKKDRYSWKTVPGWAEGYFLSSIKRVGQALECRTLIDHIFDHDINAHIVTCGDFNADSDSVPVNAIRGRIEDTGNPDLTNRVMIPCENSIPESSRYSHLHQGKGNMLDHVLVSRSLLGAYIKTEIHNEILPDESIAYATDKKFPESDHAPVIAEFELE
jgi:endonuclease/exonuclease/phosphatase family metal-dependent hydrolase